jgi:hypothetical protein
LPIPSNPAVKRRITTALSGLVDRSDYVLDGFKRLYCNRDVGLPNFIGVIFADFVVVDCGAGAALGADTVLGTNAAFGKAILFSSDLDELLPVLVTIFSTSILLSSLMLS